MMNPMQQYHQIGYQMPGQYTMPPHMQQAAYGMSQMNQQQYQAMMAQQYMHPQAMVHQQIPQMAQHMPQQFSQMQQLPPMASHMAPQQQKPVETTSLSPLDYLSNHASKSNYANGTHNGDVKEHSKSHDEQQKQHLGQNHESHQSSEQHAVEQLVADASQQVVAEAVENKV